MTDTPSDLPIAYVPGRTRPTPTREELRARIPGWGADLDPADRPSYPKLLSPEPRAGAHWEFPDRQPEHRPRERSIEHAFVTPVFGTAQPLKGLSGVVRRYSYRRFSEARLAHWLLLIAADRVDAWEEHLRSFASTRPDSPVTGVRAELTHGGLRSRRGRSDVRHQVLDPVVVVGPWVAGAGVAFAGVRALVRSLGTRAR